MTTIQFFKAETKAENQVVQPQVDELLFTQTIDLGGEKVTATVYKGDLCAIFHRVGPRGGNLGRVTVPFNLIVDAMYAITSDANQEPSQ